MGPGTALRSLFAIEKRGLMPASVYDGPRFAREREARHDYRNMLRADMRAHIDDRAAMSVDLHAPARIVVAGFIAALRSDVLP